MSLGIILAALACVAAAAAVLEVGRAAPAALSARRRAAATRAARAAGAHATRWAADRAGDPAAERLLDAAGRGAGVANADELAARERAAALLAGAWCAVLVASVAGTIVAAAAVIPAGLVARRLPRLLLARVARARASTLSDEAPDVLGLLAAGASCGLPLTALLALAGEWLPGELAAGLARGARDLRRGASADRVLAAIERDHPIDEVVALVAILQRGRQHGVPTAPALRALAEGARAAGTRRAGERAARAAPRIQLVAALLLVPAALCILGAAMVGGGLR